MNDFGLIHVYTGNGKGKTTAAVGQAMRACGHGARVIMIQFMKGRQYGELKSTACVETFQILQYGRDQFVDKSSPDPIDVDFARRGFDKAKDIMAGGECDLLILDEINVALDFGLLSLDEVLDCLRGKPEKMEIILTGRDAPREVTDLAHLVTEMREIKHPYQEGIEMRKGIEY